FKLDDVAALLTEIGLGNRPSLLVARALSGVLEVTPKPKRRRHLLRRNPAPNPLLIHGTEGMVVSFPKCCYPIPGDQVVGVLTAGRGIVVHQSACSNVVEGRGNQEKEVDVVWASDIDQDFNVELSLDVSNKRGVLATVASAVAEENGNIEDVEFSERDERFSRLRLVVALKDRKHLADLIRRLRGIKTVARVVRKKA
ncbi:MAG: ACT domain-containing protein, partial [Gammaproteobacteria bacterium]